MKVIEVVNLTKKYGNHVAVDHLSFSVERGMIYGFLGPNGAGKSTTMNMMTGYIASSEGTIRINGYDILQQPEEAKRSIGYLPELPPVYQDMTVLEYLEFVAELKKVKKSERKEQLGQIMEQTKVLEVKDRLIKNLSKGYKQRVGLAQAIVGYPEVIILDEPMVGLDPKQIIEIRELIRELAKKHTIILSSHILSEISVICDHIMIISKGKLVASDTPEGLMKLLSGGSRLSLTVEGTKERLEQVLHTIEAISEVQYATAKEANYVKAELFIAGESDIRVELFHKLAAEDLPIMELTVSEKTLEEVFLELTGEKQEQIAEQELIEELEEEDNTDDSDI